MDWTPIELAKMIDRSLLTASLTDDELQEGCRIARDSDVASICIMPYYLKRCPGTLAGISVKTSITIGSPYGGHRTAVRLAEARPALAGGGEELDFVLNTSQARGTLAPTNGGIV